MSSRPATSLPGAALLCGLLLLLTRCGKSEPPPSVCEAQELQCAEGVCSANHLTLPHCSMDGVSTVDTYALPRQAEVLTPGSHERMLERRDGQLMGELRYLRFETVPDQWYRFSFECDPGVSCSYELLDGRGKRVGEPTGRVQGELVVQLSEAQPLFVAMLIDSLFLYDREEARYRYVLETIPDDHGADPSSIPELQGSDVAFEGNTELASDADVFHVQLREGQPFQVSCVGPTASSWVAMQVTAPDGTELFASSPDGVREARQAGLHAVWVRAGPTDSDSSAAYQCRFRDLSVDN